MFIINSLRSILLCLHSGSFYKDLYFKDKKIRFLPVFLILAITNFITIFALYSLMRNTVIENADTLKSIQKIEFRNNKLSVEPQNNPLKIYDKNTPLIVFDTINKPEKYLSEKFYLVVSKSGVFLLNSTSKSYDEVYLSYYTQQNIIWDNSTIKSMIDKIIHNAELATFIIVYFIVLVVSLVFFSLKLLFFSLIGFLYGKLSDAALSLSGILRIAAFSAIPSVLIQILLNLYLLARNATVTEFYNTINRPLITNITLIIFIGYFFAALDTIRGTKKHIKN